MIMGNVSKDKQINENIYDSDNNNKQNKVGQEMTIWNFSKYKINLEYFDVYM